VSLWNFTTGDWVTSSPAVADGLVFVGSNDYNVYALNATTGVLVWKYATGSYVDSSPAVANGILYVGSEDEKVYAFGQIYYSVSFTESGLPHGTEWWVDLGGYNQSSTSDVISFSEPNGAYAYRIGSSGYTASPSAGSVSVNGANVNIYVTFTAKVPVFPLCFILPFIIIAAVVTLLAALLIIFAVGFIRRRKRGRVILRIKTV
jgi:hypothetical protein